MIRKAKKVMEFLKKVGERIRFLFLPTYSPQLNIIEPGWKYVRFKVASNINHGNIDGLKRIAKGLYHASYKGALFPISVSTARAGRTYLDLLSRENF